MNRRTIALDRIAGLLAALALLTAGAALLAWWGARIGWIPSELNGLPRRLNTTGVTDMMATAWWPWACGVVGLVLVLLGLRWLASHLPERGVGQLTLPGSSATGRLLADAATVTEAAALALESTPGVRSARGTIRRERGQVVARLTATIEREADLGLIARATDQASADLAAVLERTDLHCRAELDVAARHRPMPRVH